MKDMWGKEANIGDLFVHALRRGSSIWVHKYEIMDILETGVRARRLPETCSDDFWRYKKWVGGKYVDMTQEEREKVDKKTVIISKFGSISTIL